MLAAPVRQEELRDLLARALEVDPARLTPEARFLEDFGARSINLIIVPLVLEEELGVEISDDEADRLLTFGDVMAFLRARGIGVGEK